MKMKIALAASSILLGAILAMAPAQAEEKLKLRIATEGAYPPFNAVDTAGQLVGFDVDIAKALCEEMKADCELVAQDWDGIIPGLLAKKYDVIIASMFITEERKQKVAFTKPYYKAAMTYVMKKGGDASVLDKPDLGGESVGVQAGTTQAAFAEALHPPAISVAGRSQSRSGRRSPRHADRRSRADAGMDAEDQGRRMLRTGRQADHRSEIRRGRRGHGRAPGGQCAS